MQQQRRPTTATPPLPLLDNPTFPAAAQGLCLAAGPAALPQSPFAASATAAAGRAAAAPKSPSQRLQQQQEQEQGAGGEDDAEGATMAEATASLTSDATMQPLLSVTLSMLLSSAAAKPPPLAPPSAPTAAATAAEAPDWAPLPPQRCLPAGGSPALPAAVFPGAPLTRTLSPQLGAACVHAPAPGLQLNLTSSEAGWASSASPTISTPSPALPGLLGGLELSMEGVEEACGWGGGFDADPFAAAAAGSNIEEAGLGGLGLGLGGLSLGLGLGDGLGLAGAAEPYRPCPLEGAGSCGSLLEMGSLLGADFELGVGGGLLVEGRPAKRFKSAASAAQLADRLPSACLDDPIAGPALLPLALLPLAAPFSASSTLPHFKPLPLLGSANPGPQLTPVAEGPAATAAAAAQQARQKEPAPPTSAAQQAQQEDTQQDAPPPAIIALQQAQQGWATAAAPSLPGPEGPSAQQAEQAQQEGPTGAARNHSRKRPAGGSGRARPLPEGAAAGTREARRRAAGLLGTPNGQQEAAAGAPSNTEEGPSGDEPPAAPKAAGAASAAKADSTRAAAGAAAGALSWTPQAEVKGGKAAPGAAEGSQGGHSRGGKPAAAAAAVPSVHSMHSKGAAELSEAPTFVTFRLPPAGGGARRQPARCRFLFQKKLSASDTSALGRIVLPRVQVEEHFGACDDRAGRDFPCLDSNGREYTFKLKYWINARGTAKRMYLFENARAFCEAKGLKAGSHLAVYAAPGGRFVVDTEPLESHCG